jgi:hypothetical protein
MILFYHLVIITDTIIKIVEAEVQDAGINNENKNETRFGANEVAGSDNAAGLSL